MPSGEKVLLELLEMDSKVWLCVYTDDGRVELPPYKPPTWEEIPNE